MYNIGGINNICCKPYQQSWDIENPIAYTVRKRTEDATDQLWGDVWIGIVLDIINGIAKNV